jgi:hypothetical protein
VTELDHTIHGSVCRTHAAINPKQRGEVPTLTFVSHAPEDMIFTDRPTHNNPKVVYGHMPRLTAPPADTKALMCRDGVCKLVMCRDGVEGVTQKSGLPPDGPFPYSMLFTHTL